MPRILLLSGTSEGPLLARELLDQGYAVTATVTREEAKENLFGTFQSELTVDVGGFHEQSLEELSVAAKSRCCARRHASVCRADHVDGAPRLSKSGYALRAIRTAGLGAAAGDAIRRQFCRSRRDRASVGAAHSADAWCAATQTFRASSRSGRTLRPHPALPVVARTAHWPPVFRTRAE